MATSADQQYLTDAVGPLCEPLHRSLERARSIAEAHFLEYGMGEPEDQCGITHLTRFHLRSHLRSENLGGWNLVQNRMNGQVLLRQGMLKLRVLHEWPKDGIPAPGSNEARIHYWRNPNVGLYGVEASQLVGVWGLTKEDQIDIRIVRTVGKWRTGQAAKVDIDFPLSRTWDELADLEFRPSTGSIDVLLPFEREEDEGDADTARG
ncbi:hypothetical protein [Nonomuraea wenchangensis]|uniref:hypothetical protein n=1 Tax=Nonomuraea wenchangensis TaxID=568860 RepID=UPI00332C6F3A